MCLEPSKKEIITKDAEEDINQLDIKFRYCKVGEGFNGIKCDIRQQKWYELYVGVCTRDSKVNLDDLNNPLSEKMQQVDIQPLLNEPSNEISKNTYLYQRVRLRNEKGLNLKKAAWEDSKTVFSKTKIKRNKYPQMGAESFTHFQFKASDQERRITRKYPTLTDMLVGVVNGLRILFFVFALGYLFLYSQYHFDKYLLRKMIDTEDKTLPKRFQSNEDYTKLLKLVEYKDDTQEKKEKLTKNLTPLQNDKLSILEELSHILEKNQDLAYVVSRNVVETGINDSYMPDHYIKLLPLTLINKQVEDHFQSEETKKYSEMIKKQKNEGKKEQESSGRGRSTTFSSLGGGKLLSNLMDKMKKEEEAKNSTYKSLYSKLLMRQDHDKIH